MSRSPQRPSRARAVALGTVLLGGVVAGGCSLFPPHLPDREPVARVVRLDQNWSDEARFWFHHATQGTSTVPVPYDWFIALEQPTLRLSGDPPLLRDTAYLARLGFIPSPAGRDPGSAADATAHGYGAAAGRFTVAYDPARFPGNPDGLPVGFARTPGYPDPSTGEHLPDQLGFTCAACHTGQMTYRGTNIRIDGAPATTDFGKFTTVLELAIAYTKFVPGRFERFADRVLGPGHDPVAEAALKAKLDAFVTVGAAIAKQNEGPMQGSIEEGFGRLDALNRIGNALFSADLMGAPAPGFTATANLAPTTAPVNFPATWSTAWFDWVQHDASIRQPLVRNAGESLGVNARVNLTRPGDPGLPLYGSSVPIDEVVHMEELLAGPNPLAGTKGFKGLTSPVWPAEILGAPDPGLVERGRALYDANCSNCHRPPPNDPSGRFWDPQFWTAPDAHGQSYYKVPVVKVEVIGTDPAQANVLKTRMVKLPAYLGIPAPAAAQGGVRCVDAVDGPAVSEAPFAWALAVVTGKVIDRWYADHDTPPADQERMNGYRDNCVQAPDGYMARPLNGVWATAPYLHNGSVPSLDDLLAPAAERPKSFCVGNLEFDPVKVGYDPTCRAGMARIDTTTPGNLNSGHSFQDGPHVPGAIGKRGAFSRDERMALIAYLKTL